MTHSINNTDTNVHFLKIRAEKSQIFVMVGVRSLAIANIYVSYQLVDSELTE